MADQDALQRVLEESSRGDQPSGVESTMPNIPVPADRYFATKSELVAVSQQVNQSLQEFRNAVEKLDAKMDGVNTTIDERLTKAENKFLKWAVGILVSVLLGLALAIWRWLTGPGSPLS